MLTDNGTWDGMVGKISRNEADMGVANLFLTLHRLGAVDYSAPYDAEVGYFRYFRFEFWCLIKKKNLFFFEEGSGVSLILIGILRMW